jgi:hypothetical protein
VSIEINPLGAYEALSKQLQRIIDNICFVSAGLESVTPENYQNNPTRLVFHPSSNNRLTYDQAKASIESWLLRAVLTETTDELGPFLEEIFCICLLFSCSPSGDIDWPAFETKRADELPRFHKLGLPHKIELLGSKYGLFSEFTLHVLSLNRARNCQVHRQGMVRMADVDDNGVLQIKMRILALYRKDPDSGAVMPIEFGVAYDKSYAITQKWETRTVSFKEGDMIRLNFNDLSACVWTVWSFSGSLCDSVKSYAARCGVPIGPPVEELGDQNMLPK